MTENKLYQLFDLQRFVGDPAMQSVIDRSHKRTAPRELSDEELDYVSAAGDMSSQGYVSSGGISVSLTPTSICNKPGDPVG